MDKKTLIIGSDEEARSFAEIIAQSKEVQFPIHNHRIHTPEYEQPIRKSRQQKRAELRNNK